MLNWDVIYKKNWSLLDPLWFHCGSNLFASPGAFFSSGWGLHPMTVQFQGSVPMHVFDTNTGSIPMHVFDTNTTQLWVYWAQHQVLTFGLTCYKYHEVLFPVILHMLCTTHTSNCSCLRRVKQTHTPCWPVKKLGYKMTLLYFYLVIFVTWTSIWKIIPNEQILNEN